MTSLPHQGELEWHLFECEKYEYGKWRPRNSRYSWGDPLGLISRKQEDITPGKKEGGGGGGEGSEKNWYGEKVGVKIISDG